MSAMTIPLCVSFVYCVVFNLEMEAVPVVHFGNRHSFPADTHREDMASDLLALYQDELPVYMPWSEERRRKSDARHDPSLAQTFKETTEVRQKAAKKKSRRRSTKT